MNRHEYQAYQSLNETAKENKRIAHAHHHAPPMPKPTRKRKSLRGFLVSWELALTLYLLAVGVMFVYGSIN